MYIVMYIIMGCVTYIMANRTLVREGEMVLDPGEPGRDYLFYESRLRILPITDMRDTSKISELAENGLVCITKNGYGHLRILSEAAYRNIMERLEFLENVYAAHNVETGVDGISIEEALKNARAHFDL